MNPFVKILRRGAQNLLRGGKLYPAVFQRCFALGKAFTVRGAQRTAFHACSQVLDASAQLLQGLLALHILLCGSGLKLFALPVQRVDLGLVSDQIIRLELLECTLTFLLQLLKLSDLTFQLRAVGNDLFCFLLQCLPERRIFLLREHTAADRAACTRLKPLQKRGVLLITLSKRLHLCRILCQRPCVFWLVNLGRPSAQLRMKFLQLRVQFCRIRSFRRFTGQLLILFTGLHELLLQILQIDGFKPPRF